MFSEPVLNVNVPALQTHLKNVRLEKQSLLDKAATDKELIMSNDKFAKALLALGINPLEKYLLELEKKHGRLPRVTKNF